MIDKKTEPLDYPAAFLIDLTVLILN